MKLLRKFAESSELKLAWLFVAMWTLAAFFDALPEGVAALLFLFILFFPPLTEYALWRLDKKRPYNSNRRNK